MPQQIAKEKGLDFDEERIIRQAQTDPAAFKPVYEMYFRRIFVFVHHRIGEKELSADVTHQVFLKALTNLSKFQFRGVPFSAWVFRIALNECNDYYRKTRKARLVSLDEKATSNLFDELTYDIRLDELENRLPEMLGKLNFDELQLIQLRFFESRSFKEVGDIVGISEGNAKVKTYRAVGKIRKMFLKE